MFFIFNKTNLNYLLTINKINFFLFHMLQLDSLHAKDVNMWVTAPLNIKNLLKKKKKLKLIVNKNLN